MVKLLYFFTIALLFSSCASTSGLNTVDTDAFKNNSDSKKQYYEAAPETEVDVEDVHLYGTHAKTMPGVLNILSESELVYFTSLPQERKEYIVNSLKSRLRAAKGIVDDERRSANIVAQLNLVKELSEGKIIRLTDGTILVKEKTVQVDMPAVTINGQVFWPKKVDVIQSPARIIKLGTLSELSQVIKEQKEYDKYNE